MPEIQVKSLFYDPYRQGFDTNEWRTLLGTVALDANRIEVTDGAISHYADILKGDITFNLKSPDTPTNMNCLVGLYQPSSRAYIVFDFTGDLTAVVSDGVNTTASSAIIWDSAWTSANVKFQIIWEAGIVKFFIAGTRVATISSEYIPSGPLALYIFDGSTNPMSVGAIDVKGAQSIYMHLKTSDTAAPSEPVGSLLAFQNVTVTESVTIVIPSLVPEISDSVTVSENILLDHSLPNPEIESVTVTESITMLVVNLVPSVFDEVTITEDITAVQGGEAVISLSEDVTVSEDAVVSI